MKQVRTVIKLSLVASILTKPAPADVLDLTAALEVEYGFLSSKGVSFKTSMNFNHNWGLGSSSTLIHNLSKWADVEPFSVYWKVTSGSGYDLASCKYDKPIIYQLIKSETPKIESVNFFPEFHKNLFFIYLDKKQSSKSEIEYFDKINISSEYILSLIHI